MQRNFFTLVIHQTKKEVDNYPFDLKLFYKECLLCNW
jgi:hypothetical protein